MKNENYDEINSYGDDLLERKKYSLQVLPIDVVEKLLYELEDYNHRTETKSIYYPQYEYLATIEPASDYRVLFRIYPVSIKCLPCFNELSPLPIRPKRRMMIDEAKSILVNVKSLSEFKEEFEFVSTKFGRGNRSIKKVLKRKKFKSLKEFVRTILDNYEYRVRQVCCQVTILGSDLTTKTTSFSPLLKSKGFDCFIFSLCFS
jgi:hypothetical protein